MDWNVIVTAKEHGFKKARDFLYEFGRVNKTEYFNVMVMRVETVDQFLDDIKTAISINKVILEYVARVIPLTNTFMFQSPEEFEEKAQAIVADWVDELTGKRFHVRMHRRGFKDRLSSQNEESVLDTFIMNKLEQLGMEPAKIDFDDPDYIIAVETLGQFAGLSIWSREQLQLYPFLKMD